MGKIGCSLGTMEMGRNQCIESVPSEMIKKFINSKDIGADEIDTAIMYCGGKTEKIVGMILSKYLYLFCYLKLWTISIAIASA